MARKTKGVAWYDLDDRFPPWFRDIWVLLHPGYTLWHLAYVPIGAALVPNMRWPLLGWLVLAFFLAMGIGGHFLDELNGRPLRTNIPDRALALVAVLSIVAAMYIGIQMGTVETMWMLVCVAIGGFLVVAYNLELGNGFFHRDEWFGLSWGAFPVITAYLAEAHTLSWTALVVAAFAYFSSMAQRKLSLQARFWRRKVSGFSGSYVLYGDAVEAERHQLDIRDIVRPVDLGLKYFNAAVVAVAVGMLLMRLL